MQRCEKPADHRATGLTVVQGRGRPLTVTRIVGESTPPRRSDDRSRRRSTLLEQYSKLPNLIPSRSLRYSIRLQMEREFCHYSLLTTSLLLRVLPCYMPTRFHMLIGICERALPFNVAPPVCTRILTPHVGVGSPATCKLRAVAGASSRHRFCSAVTHTCRRGLQKSGASHT